MGDEFRTAFLFLLDRWSYDNSIMLEKLVCDLAPPLKLSYPHKFHGSTWLNQRENCIDFKSSALSISVSRRDEYGRVMEPKWTRGDEVTKFDPVSLRGVDFAPIYGSPAGFYDLPMQVVPPLITPRICYVKYRYTIASQFCEVICWSTRAPKLKLSKNQ